MLRSRAAKVALIIVGLVVLGLIVAAVAQPPPITLGSAEGAAAGAVNVNAIAVIAQTGTIRYIAAGTSRGLRVYELRQVGREYQVTDVTKE